MSDSDKDKNLISKDSYTDRDGYGVHNVTYDGKDGITSVIQTDDPSGKKTGHTTYHEDEIHTHGDHKEAWES